MLAVTLFGLCIASCYYMQVARKHPSKVLYEYTLKQSLRLDYWIIFPLMLLTFISGTGMVHLSGLSTNIPWVRNAYLFLIVNFMCWANSSMIRRHNFKYLDKPFSGARAHLLLQLLSVVIFIVIMHDAITQSTWIGT